MNNPVYLLPDQLHRALTLRDLTDPQSARPDLERLTTRSCQTTSFRLRNEVVWRRNDRPAHHAHALTASSA